MHACFVSNHDNPLTVSPPDVYACFVFCCDKPLLFISLLTCLFVHMTILFWGTGNPPSKLYPTPASIVVGSMVLVRMCAKSSLPLLGLHWFARQGHRVCSCRARTSFMCVCEFVFMVSCVHRRRLPIHFGITVYVMCVYIYRRFPFY